MIKKLHNEILYLLKLSDRNVLDNNLFTFIFKYKVLPCTCRYITVCTASSSAVRDTIVDS